MTDATPTTLSTLTIGIDLALSTVLPPTRGRSPPPSRTSRALSARAYRFFSGSGGLVLTAPATVGTGR